MKYNKQAVQKAYRLRTRGLSLRQIATIMSQELNRHIQHSQVQRWLRYYERDLR